MSARQMAKTLAATAAKVSGVNQVVFRVQRARGPFVRAVNYHGVSVADAAAFERQISWLAQRFVSVGEKQLQHLLDGQWPYDRPGILLSFDDGLRTDHEVVAPILERAGLRGWFFVPVALIQLPNERQADGARAHRVNVAQTFPDGRVFMNVAELRDLEKRGHTIGCHTRFHTRLTAVLDRQTLRREIVDAKTDLEQLLGSDVTSFCWVGGEESSYSEAAAGMVVTAGYRYAFMTKSTPIRSDTHPLQLHRTNLNPTESMALVKMKCMGSVDLFYARQRARVDDLTMKGMTDAAR